MKQGSALFFSDLLAHASCPNTSGKDRYAIIGTYQGMNVSGSAESVGKLTTVAVVQSIFSVITADALFSIVFSQMGL